MWPSIKNIIIPTSFEKAISEHNNEDSVFFSGGTYLVSIKNRKTDTLIDINNIIDKTINVSEDLITVGAGATVQDIVYNSGKLIKLSTVAKNSNFSKNIRNQRTIGGEIAQKNIRSDLFTYLIALNPILEIRNHDKYFVNLREWDGNGIINKIQISITDINLSGFERFSVLPSAPAFLMVAVVRRALELDFVVSGKTDKIFGYTMPLADFDKNKMKSMINNSVKYFKNDHYGSIEYKKSLVATGIQRAVEQI